VAQIIYSARAIEDLQGAFEFLASGERTLAIRAAAGIREAVSLLARHPQIGRRLEEGELRELVISFGKTGYLAPYRYVPVTDEVQLLSIRHQRELDYPG
jgi:plasmid stabilization system protein ParE